MITHFRNYDTVINGKSINHHVSIEAISIDCIKKTMRYHSEKFIKAGIANENDKIEFHFKYCHT